MTESKKRPRPEVEVEAMIGVEGIREDARMALKMLDLGDVEDIECFLRCEVPKDGSGRDAACAVRCVAPSGASPPEVLAEETAGVFAKGTSACLPVKKGDREMCVYFDLKQSG